MSGNVTKCELNSCANGINAQILDTNRISNQTETRGNHPSNSNAENIPCNQNDRNGQPVQSGTGDSVNTTAGEANNQESQPVNVNNIDPELRKYTKLFVGGLPFTSGDDALYDYFSKFGPIVEAVVIREKCNNSSKGYGFVTMGDIQSAEKAVQNMYPDIDGRRCNVNYAYIGAKKNRHNRHFRQYFDEFPDGALYGFNNEYNYNYSSYPYFDYNMPFWTQVPYHPQYNAYSPYEFRPIYTHPINGHWSYGGTTYPHNPLLSPIIIVRPASVTQIDITPNRPAVVTCANTQTVNSLAQSLASATLIHASESSAAQSQPPNEEGTSPVTSEPVETISTSKKTSPTPIHTLSNSIEKQE